MSAAVFFILVAGSSLQSIAIDARGRQSIDEEKLHVTSVMHAAKKLHAAMPDFVQRVRDFKGNIESIGREAVNSTTTNSKPASAFLSEVSLQANQKTSIAAIDRNLAESLMHANATVHHSFGHAHCGAKTMCVFFDCGSFNATDKLFTYARDKLHCPEELLQQVNCGTCVHNMKCNRGTCETNTIDKNDEPGQSEVVNLAMARLRSLTEELAISEMTMHRLQHAANRFNLRVDSTVIPMVQNLDHRVLTLESYVAHIVSTPITTTTHARWYSAGEWTYAKNPTTTTPAAHSLASAPAADPSTTTTTPATASRGSLADDQESIFQAYDKNRDGLLNKSETAEMLKALDKDPDEMLKALKDQVKSHSKILHDSKIRDGSKIFPSKVPQPIAQQAPQPAAQPAAPAAPQPATQPASEPAPQLPSLGLYLSPVNSRVSQKKVAPQPAPQPGRAEHDQKNLEHALASQPVSQVAPQTAPRRRPKNALFRAEPDANGDDSYYYSSTPLEATGGSEIM